MKKKLFLLFAGALLAIAGHAQATVIASGTCGENLTWTLTSDSTLTISGEGAMDDSGRWMDYQRTIKTVDIQEGVTSIGYAAFSYCSGLTNLTISNSVISIRSYAFYECRGLSSLTLGNQIASIGSYAFSGCYSLTTLTIPQSVITIGENAFHGCSNLTSVTIPESVTIIYSDAFSGCSGLTSITIPNSVTSIEERAFSYCSGLTSINFNAVNCTNTGIWSYSVFFGCTNLTTVNIGSEVKTIPNNVFPYCSGLTSITIPGSVTSIGESAFSGCSGLTEVIFEDGTTTLSFGTSAASQDTFKDCPLTTLYLGRNIHYYFFPSPFIGKTTLSSLTIGNSVTSIGESAFSGCSGLTKVTIPERVTNIGEVAFDNCQRLTTIIIPSSVTSIGRYAFRNCTGLTSVTVNWQTPLSINSSVFQNIDVSKIKLIVPSGTASAYRSATVWKNFQIEESNGIDIAAAADPILSTQYYTLQGVAVKYPQAGQLYIVKETRQSGKVTSEPRFF